MNAPVTDPWGIAADPALADTLPALDPVVMEARLGELPRLRSGGRVRILAIRVIRHKPGRRCMVEYDLELGSGGERHATLIGKARAGRRPETAFRLMEGFRAAGFGDDASDGIGVPEPVGSFSDLGLWLQRRVPGRPMTDCMESPAAPRLMARIAEAARKVHLSGVPTRRVHGMTDEIRILDEHLPKAASARPDLASRISAVLDAAGRMGRALPAPAATGVHRDFYQDQVLVDGEKLWLIDFDLYCMGDPGLDVGNFLGHVIEQSLRVRGDAAAWAPLQRAMTERFCALAGDAARPAVEAYTDLTLVRHIYLSTLFEARRPLTGALVALCEGRLAPWM